MISTQSFCYNNKAKTQNMLLEGEDGTGNPNFFGYVKFHLQF